MIERKDNQIIIHKKNISVTVSEVSGVAIINLNVPYSNGKSFSDIVITKKDHHYMIEGTYQKVYSRAQLEWYLKETYGTVSGAPIDKIQKLVSSSDYYITKHHGILKTEEKIHFCHPKIFLLTKNPFKVDCPDYVLST